MDLWFDDYENHQELFEKINRVNELYYIPASKNIAYLQKHKEETSIVYAIALRDAYSHLAKIFEYQDILANKAKIVRQLERYMGHLEAMLYDTFLKIIKMKSDALFSQLREGDKPKIKNQLAIKLKNVRMVDDKIDIQDKIEDFEKIISFIEDVYTKHQF